MAATLTGGFLLSGAVSPLAPLTGPLTSQKLYDHVMRAGITSKAELLASLPENVRSRVVLMTDSKSRQRGTRLLPRAIEWSADVRFIVANSGHPRRLDANADSIEMLEFDDVSKNWKMSSIDFEKGRALPLNANQSRCIGCHGVSPRPIWGEYPNWPHAYGGSLGHAGVDRMTPEEYADLQKFLALKDKHEAYRHLKLSPTGSGLYFGSVYGYPNTTFGARLAARNAEHVFARLARAARYSKYRYAYQLISPNLHCPEVSPEITQAIDRDYEARLKLDPEFRDKWTKGAGAAQTARMALTRLYRLLDVDPLRDMRMDDSPATPLVYPGPHDESAAWRWNSGGDSIGELVDFLGFKEIWDVDPALKEFFRSKTTQIEATYRYAFRASAAELERLDLLAQREGIQNQIVVAEMRKAELIKASASKQELEAAAREINGLRRKKEEKGDYYFDSLFPFLRFNIFNPVLAEGYWKYGPETGEGRQKAVCAHLTARALDAIRGGRLTSR